MKQLPWMKDLQIGDVLQKPHGRPRVVRGLGRNEKGKLIGVYFAIKRCSWTGRCTTVYGYSDLITLRYEKIDNIRVKLRRRIDRLISHDIKDHRLRRLNCCDVKGIP